MRNHLREFAYRYSPALGAALFAVLVAGDADAQRARFNFSISPSEPLLVAPNDPIVQHIEAWDSPLMRIVKQSRPFVEVTNTSNDGINLTEFRITIGDTDYNFTDEILGGFAVLGASTPDVSISSTTEMGGDELVITFGDGGLAPGEVARFQIDLDGDDNVPGLFIHPDYRTVMFDLFENDNSDNSQLFASFDDTITGMTLQASGTQQDLNLPPGSVFANSIVRPYSVMAGIENTGFDVDPVPEPSTLLLGLMAIVGAGAAAMRRRLG